MGKKIFGTDEAGEEIYAYTIGNNGGMRVVATDYGATLVSVFVRDKNGLDTDVILGYNNYEEYQKGGSYFGATVGRNCNRIAGAKVTIDGVTYPLEANDNNNNLHSGKRGVSLRKWDLIEELENRVVFRIKDGDLEQGFPGNAKITVSFEVTEQNELKITYRAVSDKKTVFNFTNHSYFNLNGAGSGTAMGQVLKLYASAMTPVDAHAIPTGEIVPVENTPFDFREAKPIGRDIGSEDPQLGLANGYDHNFVLDGEDGYKPAAEAYSKDSGIRMKVYTDCPGVQLYTANFPGTQKGKKGLIYHGRDAFCLETQYFPNAVNEPAFEAPITEAGKEYISQTTYAFDLYES